MTFRVYPVTRDVARAFVGAFHSHHDPHVVDRFCIGGFVGIELVAVSVLASPVAPSLDRDGAWEVTRLCVGPGAPHCAASRLLGATTRTARAAGVSRLVSYTRVDESGTCYRAAGWRPVALVRGRPHTTGNRARRWLPGLYAPSTEIVDRVRWEYGAGADGCVWDGAIWTSADPVPRIDKSRAKGAAA